MFCKKCGSLLLPKEGVMKCSDCDYTQAEGLLKDRKKKNNDLDVMDKDAGETKPKTAADCAKCGNKEAYTWSLQTRSADEPETIFFKCVKCSHTWRSYG
ncbi:MAG: transcription factor S [Candidatus Nanoarchaeia archaeon]